MKELSEVWDSLSDISQATILEKIGGKHNANVAMSLLSNFQTAEEVLQKTADASGSALAENEKYLNSINGKIAQFQSAFEGLSAAVVNSEIVKGVVSFGTNAIHVLTNIIDKFGALKTALVAVTSAATALTGLKNNGHSIGAFSLIDGKIMQDLTGVKAKISEFNKATILSAEAQASFIKTTSNSNQTLANYFKTVQNGSATYEGYRAYVKQAGVATQDFGAKAKVAALGVDLLNTALNSILVAGISFLIEKAAEAISHVVHATEEAVERTTELNETFETFKSTNSDNISTLESMKDEFDELSTGVSQYGENVALSADEYERYKEIVQKVVEISPELASGYSVENGYLADKNDLIERAIELQKEQYQLELDNMTTTENLVTGMEGYIATYGDLKDNDVYEAQRDLSSSLNAIYSPDISQRPQSNLDIHVGHQAFAVVAEEILKALDQSLSPKEIEKILSSYIKDYEFDTEGFWADYAEQISRNIHSITASIDWASLGYESAEEFQEAASVAEEAAQSYLKADDEASQAAQGALNQLQLIAQANSEFAGLSTETQTAISDFISGLNIEDLTKTEGMLWWKKVVPDEEAIEEVRKRINGLIEVMAEGGNDVISVMSAFQESFNNGDIGVGEYMSTIDDALVGLQDDLNAVADAYGFTEDDVGNLVKSLRVTLQVDEIDEQITAVEDGLTDLNDEYAAIINNMSARDLSIAYRIIMSSDSQMSFDALQGRIIAIERQMGEFKNVLDFSGMVQNLDAARNGLDGIISAMDRLNQGTALTKQELANLALQYPKLLEQSNLFVDGSIEGQRQILGAVLEMNEAEYDAQLDEKIAELKAAEQVANDQLALEADKLNVLNIIDTEYKNGELTQQEDLISKLQEYYNLQGQNYFSMKDGELTVNEDALNTQLDEEHDYGEKSAEEVWKPAGQMIVQSFGEGTTKGGKAMKSGLSKIFKTVMPAIREMLRGIGNAIKDGLSGNVQAAFNDISGGLSNALSELFGNNQADEDEVTVTFDGSGGVTVDDLSLDDWVDREEKNTKERIKQIEDFKERTVTAYKNLEALRDLDLTSIYGSAGTGYGSQNVGSGGSGSSYSPSSGSSSGYDYSPSTSDDSGYSSDYNYSDYEPYEYDRDTYEHDTEEYEKQVDEYKADIDKYYMAVKRLEEAQARRQSLEKKIEHELNPATKAKLSGDLMKAYAQEADAEQNLINLKKQTIAQNAEALRALGFEVEYNADTNGLYIKNLEHLNELTATSAGKYETLQEATNALRQETEQLINTTEQLNDDNIAGLANIEDLNNSIIETKNNIIDYVEEVYDKQIEAYQEVIDKRKELIESAEDEYDYEDDIAEKVKEIAELQSKIDQLSLDDSREAQAQRNELIEQLNEKQKDLNDTQQDHAQQAELESLDKMSEEYKKSREDNLEELRNSLLNSQDQWFAFFQTLNGQNVNVGDSINKNIIDAWIRAAQAVRDYGAAIDGTLGTDFASISSVPKFHSGGVVDKANIGQSEALAILQKGEVVLDAEKQDSLYKIIDFQERLAARLGRSDNAQATGVSPSIAKILGDVITAPTTSESSFVFEPQITVQINGLGSTSPADARQFGTQIADVAMDKLYEAFERKGIGSTRGARLRP